MSKTIKAFPWTTGDGLICEETECKYSRECANHSSAGDFRSEEGASPNLSLIKGEVICASYSEGFTLSDEGFILSGLGMVAIGDLLKPTDSTDYKKLCIELTEILEKIQTCEDCIPGAACKKHNEIYFNCLKQILLEVHKNNAPENWWNHHHPDCGTAYRGCPPTLCPKDQYEKTGIWRSPLPGNSWNS
jgi:hypothetical protein